MTGISDVVRTLLKKRGVEREADIAAFLEPDYDLHTHDPFLLQGMERAVERLLAAMEQKERIAVYADFDCDGIPGAALLADFFKKAGHSTVEVYVPHRDREGYGFHEEAVAQLAERGATLIITVDVGTNAVETVRFARERGVDVIVTDHHEISSVLPDALAVINPKLGSYPFRNLCGAAVAFKLAQAAVREGKRRGLPSFTCIPDGWEKWLLDLVAIATVADMVPLVGENRVLVRYGLRVLRKSPRPGLRALAARLRLAQEQLTEDDIGFSIAPRINAASRMDEPDLALRLLTTADPTEAEHLAARLETLNAKRKGVVAAIVKEARAHVRARFSPEDRVIVLGDPAWRPALLGLAANSIVGERGGVVCLWGRDAQGRLKGSCRSDGLSLVELFAHARSAFTECGGHEYSGGFSVSHERVHALQDALLQAAAAASDPVRSPREADLPLALSDVSRALFADLSLLAPFGIGNPKPLLRVGGVVVTEMRRFGKEGVHIELALECRSSGKRLRAFDFYRAHESFTHIPTQGSGATVLGTLDRDSFRGGFSLRITDVLPAHAS